MDSEETPDWKRRCIYLDMTLLEKHITQLKYLGKDIEVIKPLQREQLQLSMVATEIDNNAEEIGDDITFSAPVKLVPCRSYVNLSTTLFYGVLSSSIDHITHNP